MERIELEPVQRITGGRVHLTPHVPESGPVVTLCGQTLRPGAYRGVQAEVDCRTCLRRRDDPGRVSSAFFQSDVGSELLERSLEQARVRRAQRTAEPEPAAPAAEGPAPGARARRETPAAPPPEPRPAPAIAELRSGTPLRRAFENVSISPEGVLIRVDGGAVQHVTFNGPVDVRRRDGKLTVRVGDVTLEFDLA